MSLTVLICVLSVAVAARSQLRIIDGLPASPGQFPYLVRLSLFFKPTLVNPPKGNSCGGSLISDRWILTAGHCLAKAESALVFFGTVEFSCTDCLRVYSAEFVIHEKFEDLSHENDVGLVNLPEAVEFNEFIKPIGLARGEEDFLGEMVTLSGWGKVSDGPLEYPPYLQFVSMNVISNEQCSTMHFGIVKSMICTLGEDIQSGCEGDSGGPLIIPGESPLQIGVVNFGSDEGCTKGFPSVFARVSEFVDWIEEKTQMKS